MQLGKSLAGALIGGVLGIALCLAIYFAFQWDKAWLAIPVAILTGLGVRSLADTRGHVSYARGALTALVAIAAFLLFYPIAGQITTWGAAAKPITAQAASQPDAGKANDEAADATAENTAPVVAVRNEEGGPIGGAAGRNQRPPERSPLEYVALALAAFIAYELGRGSGIARPQPGVTTPDDEPAAAPLGQTVPPPD